MLSLAAVIETALVASFRMSSPVNEAEAHRASVRGHARIVDAIEAGDGARAADAMREIIGHGLDRKSVVEGKSVSVRVDLGGRRIIKKKSNTTTKNRRAIKKKK